MITGNVIGGRIKNPDTIIMVDEYGNEYTTAMSGEEVELTATTNDVRLGKVAALETGIKTGEKEIPSYITSEGYKVIPAGSNFMLYIPRYNYTKLQAIFCPFNTSMSDSVSAEKVAIENKVYPSKSTVFEQQIVIDDTNKAVNFGIFNADNIPWLIRYFTYKEIY